MKQSSPKLEWCIVRLGNDLNWWVDEISDPIHWDVDGLAIIDPRQKAHIIELIDPLRDYGFDMEALESAFFGFRIDSDAGDQRVKLTRVRDSLLETEDNLFALPDILDEEKGPYSDFLDMITRCRVRMLNDLISFKQPLTVDEVEEEIREMQSLEYSEGKAVHFISEIVSILEYIPDGYELERDDDDDSSDGDEKVIVEDFPDLDDDETIEEDETMKWDEDEEEEEEEEEEKDSDEEDEDDRL
jgi:hypothetical protein